MEELDPHDVIANCRKAFEAAEGLGIPKVIEPRDMNLLAVPDKLAVMTYLHQLRAYFTGNELEIERLGTNSDDTTSYVIGNYRTDSNAATLLNLKDLKMQLKHRNSFDEEMPNDLSPSLIHHDHPHHTKLRESPAKDSTFRHHSPIKEIKFDSMVEPAIKTTPLDITRVVDKESSPLPASPTGFSFTTNVSLFVHSFNFRFD